MGRPFEIDLTLGVQREIGGAWKEVAQVINKRQTRVGEFPGVSMWFRARQKVVHELRLPIGRKRSSLASLPCKTDSYLFGGCWSSKVLEANPGVMPRCEFAGQRDDQQTC